LRRCLWSGCFSGNRYAGCITPPMYFALPRLRRPLFALCKVAHARLLVRESTLQTLCGGLQCMRRQVRKTRRSKRIVCHCRRSLPRKRRYLRTHLRSVTGIGLRNRALLDGSILWSHQSCCAMLSACFYITECCNRRGHVRSEMYLVMRA
jgi:hypothetical protein